MTTEAKLYFSSKPYVNHMGSSVSQPVSRTNKRNNKQTKTHVVIGTIKLVLLYFLLKMVYLHKGKSKYEIDPWTIISVNMNCFIRIQCWTNLEWLNIQRVTPFLTTKLKNLTNVSFKLHKNWVSLFNKHLFVIKCLTDSFDCYSYYSENHFFDLKTLRFFVPFLPATPFRGDKWHRPRICLI